MRFCAVICEYNPFHNGHRYQLDVIREKSGCDKIICLMSGNFTQRGDIAVFDKFTRARHAVECGADVVLELPTPFAVSSAEIFARGAVSILSSIPDVEVLAFGCESGTGADFLQVALATLSEDKRFKELLKEKMKDGTSYVKARTQTVLELNGDVDEALLTSPNNILGTEYCRAILQQKSRIAPFAIPRIGGGYADTALLKNFSSATALRACMAEGTKKSKKALRDNLPECVYRTALECTPNAYEEAVMCALIATDAQTLALTPDCTEGLENRLKALAKTNPQYADFLAKTVTKRYTLARIKRILAANFLGIREKAVKQYLQSPLYYKVLAVKQESSEEIFSALGRGSFPLIVRKSDTLALKKEALSCFECDVRASTLYSALTKRSMNEYQTVFV